MYNIFVCNIVCVLDKKINDENNIDKDLSDMKNMQDLDLRKMVFEVIFGQNESVPDSDNTSNKSDYENLKESEVCIETSEITNIASRPVRNRVKPINKDFIYDLNEFTDMPRSVSQNSNRIGEQSDKHITGSLEDLTFGKNKYLVKKANKKPGPKCKTMYCVDVSDSRTINLHLQNNGNSDNDLKKCSQLPEDEEDFKGFSTNMISLSESKNSTVEETPERISDILVIEDD